MEPCVFVTESEGFDVGGGCEPVVERVCFRTYYLNVCLIREARFAVGEMGIALVIDRRNVDAETYGDGIIHLGVVSCTCSSPVASKSCLVAELLASFHYIHYASGELEVGNWTGELNLYFYITMSVV